MPSKGNGTSGGGLAARVKEWLALKGGALSSPVTYKMGNGETYHKPGSQNPSKGGKGRA